MEHYSENKFDTASVLYDLTRKILNLCKEDIFFPDSTNLFASMDLSNHLNCIPIVLCTFSIPSLFAILFHTHAECNLVVTIYLCKGIYAPSSFKGHFRVIKDVRPNETIKVAICQSGQSHLSSNTRRTRQPEARLISICLSCKDCRRDRFCDLQNQGYWLFTFEFETEDTQEVSSKTWIMDNGTMRQVRQIKMLGNKQINRTNFRENL